MSWLSKGLMILLGLNTLSAVFGCWCGEWHIAQAAPHIQAQAAGIEPAVRPASPSLAAQAWQLILSSQAAINRELIATVRLIKDGSPFSGTLTLVLLAFGYGVLHAAGPGHGKAVISSYVLANEETVRRGIALSFLAALFQALSAILFVGVLLMLMRQTSLTLRMAEAQLETLSWVLIVGVGLWMLWRQFPRSSRQVAGGPVVTAENLQGFAPPHVHRDDCGCGHAHMPNPRDVAGSWSWRKAIPIAVAIGIRPCTGALLLLIFSFGQGLLWAGVLGTFAMAIGTALTVSALAAFAISSRYWAVRLSGPERPWGRRLKRSIGVIASLVVILLGVAGVMASLGPVRPFGL
ncbi:MAG: nickel/cobalt transporter [Hyphomicrobiaceae bacterium]